VQGIKAIKALVAFMGVLLLSGLGLLAYGVATKTGQSGAKPVAGAVSATYRTEDFGAVAVPVPAGARVEQTLVVGERVVVRISGGGDRLIVLDPADGSVAGSFVLVPEAPAGQR
jgi:hypothetical protein